MYYKDELLDYTQHYKGRINKLSASSEDLDNITNEVWEVVHSEFSDYLIYFLNLGKKLGWTFEYTPELSSSEEDQVFIKTKDGYSVFFFSPGFQDFETDASDALSEFLDDENIPRDLITYFIDNLQIK